MDIQILQDYLPMLFIVALWELVWKGFALWRAAQRGSKVWFVVMLLVNSVGILPIVYLFISGKLSLSVREDGPTDN